jgi:hypothetical protein
MPAGFIWRLSLFEMPNKEFWQTLENEANLKWILVWVFTEISVDWSLGLNFSTHNLHYQFVKCHHKYVSNSDPVIGE